MQAFAERTWGATQEHLRSLLNPDTYNLWFAPLRARAQDDTSLVLEVADEFCGIWLKENYVGLLEEALALVSGRRLKIRFEVGSSRVGTPLEAPNPGPIKAKVANGAPERNHHGQELNLRPQNNFDAFVVGNSNNFAHAAALAVAQEPREGVQPAVPARWSWFGQDAFAARHWAPRRDPPKRSEGRLPFIRAIYQRIH